ncbi:MAG TPA: biotin/lipoyl-containing protein [Pyrinomonadaceae bacterium]
MKLIADIDGERHTLEVGREGGGRVVAEVDGRRHELEASEVEPGVYLFVREGEVFEIHLGGAAGAAGASPPEISVRHRGGHGAYAVRVIDPKRLRGARAAAGHDAGRAQITAPMPGKVVRVLVELGQEVEAGQPVVVVEAMKMQNELKSPKAGAVVALHAAVGATVNSGDILAEIE